LRNAAKRAAGIAPERSLPPFAREPFTAWFRRRTPGRTDGPRILLWPDTFNTYFRPETAIAATHALEAAGFQVAIPERPLCCGRPLYDWGWLGTAKRLWRETLTTLRTEIEAGTPLVGLEPACLAAFKDELVNFFPDNALAKRLSAQSVFFSDFLAQHAAGLRLHGREKALVQIHCHQHAIVRADGERSLLDSLGVDYEILPSGCCGMAGAFGFATDLRGRHGGRRKGASPNGSLRPVRYARPRERLQLPGTDRAGQWPQDAPRRRTGGALARTAKRMMQSRVKHP